MADKVTIVAETPRLILRHFTVEDAPALHAVLSNPEVMRFSLTGPKTLEKTREFILTAAKQQRSDGFAVWAVIHKKTARIIGYCGLMPRVLDGADEIELTYRLDRAFWGQGLGAEATLAVKDHAEKKLGLTRLIALIEPANTRSIRLAESSGMCFEGNSQYGTTAVKVYTTAKTPRRGLSP